VLRKLTRKYNLVFIKFKPLLTYLSILLDILTSARGILMFLTLKRLVRKHFRRVHNYLKPRSDLEEV
jgi:hypothetical protein